MRHAVDSLLTGGDRVEIIIVDDGSTDDTAKIADEYKEKYPDNIKVIHKENGGHGDAVVAGIHEATGLFFKILDSDDRFDPDALKTVLDKMERMEESGELPDLIVTNYIYVRPDENWTRSMPFRKSLPADRIIGWDEVGRFSVGAYILHHAATFRTQILRDCNLELPKHMFYVDHLYMCRPMRLVEKLYYIDVDFYQYYIGRPDQSVNEKVMLSRIDQQLEINRALMYDLDLESIEDKNKRDYLYYYIEIVTNATVCFLLRTGKQEDEDMVRSFIDEIREKNPVIYDLYTSKPFYQHPIGALLRLPKWFSYPIYLDTYLLMRRLYKFN
jgi:glycosyltransferase involved in cell wall biosynthesis